MIKIIKRGERKKVICPECDCYFSYEPEDTQKEEYKIFNNKSKYVKIIICPQCNYKIVVEASK